MAFFFSKKQSPTPSESAAAISPFLVSKNYKKKRFYTRRSSPEFCLRRIYLRSFVFVIHYFRIFSWGSVAFFFSPLQRTLRLVCHFWSLKCTRKSTLLFSSVESGVPSLSYLPQIVRFVAHFFRIFSWGILALFFSPLQRALWLFRHFCSLKCTRKSTLLYLSVKSGVPSSSYFPQIVRLCRTFFSYFQLGNCGLFLFTPSERAAVISPFLVAKMYKKKCAFIFIGRVRSSIFIVFTSDHSFLSHIFSYLQLG